MRQADPTGGDPTSGIRALGRRSRVILVVVVLAAIVAVSTSSGALGGDGRSGSPVMSQLWWRVALGAILGGLVGGAILAVLHRLSPSHPGLARSLYGEIPEPWHTGFSPAKYITAPRSGRRALRRAMPLLLVAVAIGALIGASTVPLQAKTSLPPPSRKAATSQDGKPSEEVDGRFNDTNGDGNAELQIDADGDGKYESVYVFCPGSEPPTEGPGPDVSLPPGQKPGTVRIPIDDQCDGTIERYVDVRTDQLGRIRTAPAVSIKPNGSVAPTTAPSQANKISIPSGIGTLLLILLIAAVVGAIVYGFANRNRNPGVHEETVEEGSIDTRQSAVVAASVERSRTELIADNDPRRAIITAYESLLGGLGAAGLPRRNQEAPEEYLRRCLTGVPVDHAPFHELTRLFGLARYSSHDITETHRSAAQSALAQAAASLQRVPAAAPS